MGDQIIPYMALAGDSKIKIAELTQHTLTNIYVAEAFIKKKFKVEGKLENKAIVESMEFEIWDIKLDSDF